MAKIKDSAALSLERPGGGRTGIRFVDGMFSPESSALYDILSSVAGVENPRVMLVADSNVVHRQEGLGTAIGKYVQTYGIVLAGSPVVVGGGEKAKCDEWQSVQRVMTATLEAKVGVNDVMLAIGGGAVLDVAGYAAAQARGGIKLVRVPTTPAAMVDAAYATSAAMNMCGIKDALKVPSRPDAVVIDVTLAGTVLDGVWRGGFGEIVRQAAVIDPALMKKIAKNPEALKERDLDVLGAMVRASVETRVKKGATDFAQWCALRLEAMSGYKLPHGYAVPISVCIECAYAVERGFLKAADQETICGTLAECGALDGLHHSFHLLAQPERILFGLDAKELSSGSPAIVLPAGIGKQIVDEAPDRELYKKVIKEFLAVSTGQ